MATTAYPASPKQLAYITSLREDAFSRFLYAYWGRPQVKSAALVELAIAYHLPATAVTSREASEIIDAYKNPVTYAQAHKDWAMPILTRLAERFGRDGSQAPAVVDCSSAEHICETCGANRRAPIIDGHHNVADWLATVFA